MRGFVRAAAAAVLCLTIICGSEPSAFAGDTTTLPTSTTATPKMKDGQLSSRVTVSGTGLGGGGGSQHITSSDVNFTPPDCWYEEFTPDEFEAVLNQRYDDAGNDNADSIYDYYYQVRSDMTAINYHRGDDGNWWLLVYNPSLPPDTAGSCDLTDQWMWVGPGDPPPPAVITPQMLSKVAYGATQLPTRTVTLSPAAANQKVNLATYVKFADALPRVFVTAQVPNPPVAATVVAEPYSLHIDAGTSYADPQTCDYRFEQVGDTYNIDTAGAACNVTYRRATAAGASYTLKAQITWRVHWTPSANPDGPPADPAMPDGYTTSPQQVAVQEIQTVNR